uniref:hypothetical protein n=1 Tax=Roseivirga sp. TaxID=1964215 RepID=UPI0040577815
MIKYIIVDDEPLAHELIEEFCGMLPHLKLEKNCYNAIEAMQFFKYQIGGSYVFRPKYAQTERF